MPGRMEYPDDIRTLTSLRFLAALMVFLHHIFQFFPGEINTSLFEKGYLAVDLFFILSGFILSHVYGRSFPGTRGAYRMFWVRRFARIYPVHFLILLFLIFWASRGVFYGSLEMGNISIVALLDNLLLLHGWGLPGALAWNGPSWSISGEWFAYLLFPFLLPPLMRLQTNFLLILSCMVYACIWWVSYIFDSDMPLTTYTSALRVVPAFVLGMALYRCGSGFTFSYSRYFVAPIACTALVFMHMGTADIFIVGLFGVLIWLLADISRRPSFSYGLSGDVPVFLGQVSYAFYMLHYPLVVIVFSPYFSEQGSILFFKGLFIVGGVLLGLAVILYLYVEVPARRWIVRRFGGDAAVAE